MDSEQTTRLPMEENLTKEALADPKTLAESVRMSVASMIFHSLSSA